MNAISTDLRASELRATDHVRGHAAAHLVLLEYGDFQCPTCKQAAPVVDLLLDQYSTQIQFAFRHYPLEQLHPHALLAAEAAECAGAQGRFWEMHRMLFQNQQYLHARALEGYGEQLQLDMGRFRQQMETHAHLPKIRADIELGQRARVRSTPGFFLNGKLQDVSFGMQSLHDAVQLALR